MPQLSRSEIAIYVACAVLVAVLGWRAMASQRQGPAAHAPTGTAGAIRVSAAAPRTAIVHVVGAVRRPGVYRLRVGQRVQDAIRRAGGARAGADLQAINLAAKLSDAQQVAVPRRAAAMTAAAPAAARAPAAAAGAAASPPAPPVNLNTATAEQLDTLDGVGPATAQKILEYRTAHGGFSSIDDLAQISGIGPKTLESLRTQVQL
ncbi:MAG TPA: ComEA family DNA-binding protein [Baekduia sp.]|nr:ComEA family DNA-binding protein [Baekduia sp.]